MPTNPHPTTNPDPEDPDPIYHKPAPVPCISISSTLPKFEENATAAFNSLDLSKLDFIEIHYRYKK